MSLSKVFATLIDDDVLVVKAHLSQFLDPAIVSLTSLPELTGSLIHSWLLQPHHLEHQWV